MTVVLEGRNYTIENQIVSQDMAVELSLCISEAVIIHRYCMLAKSDLDGIMLNFELLISFVR